MKTPVRADDFDLLDADGKIIVDAQLSDFQTQADRAHLAEIARRVNAFDGLLELLQRCPGAIRGHMYPSSSIRLIEEIEAALTGGKVLAFMLTSSIRLIEEIEAALKLMEEPRATTTPPA